MKTSLTNINRVGSHAGHALYKIVREKLKKHRKSNPEIFKTLRRTGLLSQKKKLDLLGTRNYVFEVL